MASEAQTRAAAFVDTVLRGRLIPRDVTLRGRRMDDGSMGATVTIPSNMAAGMLGECWQTVELPLDATHHGHRAAAERITQLIERHLDVVAAVADYDAERLACDHDPDADMDVDDDMPVPASRMSCSLVLRTALDALSVGSRTREGIVERRDTLERKGVTISIDDVEDMQEADAKAGRPPRAIPVWVRRASIEKGGARWSMGVNQHYLDLPQPMPETTRRAIAGMLVREVTDMPGLATAPGVIVRSAASHKGGTRLNLSRAFAFLGGPTAESRR